MPRRRRRDPSDLLWPDYEKLAGTQMVTVRPARGWCVVNLNGVMIGGVCWTQQEAKELWLGREGSVYGNDWKSASRVLRVRCVPVRIESEQPQIKVLDCSVRKIQQTIYAAMQRRDGSPDGKVFTNFRVGSRKEMSLHPDDCLMRALAKQEPTYCSQFGLGTKVVVCVCSVTPTTVTVWLPYWRRVSLDVAELRAELEAEEARRRRGLL